MELCLRAPALTRQPYPSDVSDEEWAFVVPYLALCRLEAPQRQYDLREVFNALRWMVRTGAQWRMMPNHFPPWPAVYQQTQRWLRAGVFESLVHDLGALLRRANGRAPEPRAMILDAQTLQSTPESGSRAGYDGYKRKRGSKLHAAVDTLGYLLSLRVTVASEPDRAQVGAVAAEVQALTGGTVELAWVDQGYTGDEAAEAAADHGVTLEVVARPEGQRGFVLLPRRWVVERSFVWKSRFRRLIRNYECLPQTVAGLHFLAFAWLMLAQFFRSS